MADPAVDWTPGDGSPTDKLTLADWRRRVAALYVEVRAMAASDPEVAHAHWRAAREPETGFRPSWLDELQDTKRASRRSENDGLRLTIEPQPSGAGRRQREEIVGPLPLAALSSSHMKISGTHTGFEGFAGTAWNSSM